MSRDASTDPRSPSLPLTPACHADTARHRTGASLAHLLTGPRFHCVPGELARLDPVARPLTPWVHDPDARPVPVQPVEPVARLRSIGRYAATVRRDPGSGAGDHGTADAELEAMRAKWRYVWQTWYQELRPTQGATAGLGRGFTPSLDALYEARRVVSALVWNPWKDGLTRPEPVRPTEADLAAWMEPGEYREPKEKRDTYWRGSALRIASWRKVEAPAASWRDESAGQSAELVGLCYRSMRGVMERTARSLPPFRKAALASCTRIAPRRLVDSALRGQLAAALRPGASCAGRPGDRYPMPEEHRARWYAEPLPSDCAERWIGGKPPAPRYRIPARAKITWPRLRSGKVGTTFEASATCLRCGVPLGPENTFKEAWKAGRCGKCAECYDSLYDQKRPKRIVAPAEDPHGDMPAHERRRLYGPAFDVEGGTPAPKPYWRVRVQRDLAQKPPAWMRARNLRAFAEEHGYQDQGNTEAWRIVREWVEEDIATSPPPESPRSYSDFDPHKRQREANRRESLWMRYMRRKLWASGFLDRAGKVVMVPAARRPFVYRITKWTGETFTKWQDGSVESSQEAHEAVRIARLCRRCGAAFHCETCPECGAPRKWRPLDLGTLPYWPRRHDGIGFRTPTLTGDYTLHVRREREDAGTFTSKVPAPTVRLDLVDIGGGMLGLDLRLPAHRTVLRWWFCPGSVLRIGAAPTPLPAASHPLTTATPLERWERGWAPVAPYYENKVPSMPSIRTRYAFRSIVAKHRERGLDPGAAKIALEPDVELLAVLLAREERDMLARIIVYSFDYWLGDSDEEANYFQAGDDETVDLGPGTTPDGQKARLELKWRLHTLRNTAKADSSELRMLGRLEAACSWPVAPAEAAVAAVKRYNAADSATGRGGKDALYRLRKMLLG